MVWLTLLVSLLGGGLAGGVVSTLYNRSLRRRILRTELYAKVSDMPSAYLIRFTETPQGRGTVLVRVVGKEPLGADRDFIEHRTAFVQGLVAYNELEEARKLRQAILDNETKELKPTGAISELDLQPESEAFNACMKKLHEELELDKR